MLGNHFSQESTRAKKYWIVIIGITAFNVCKIKELDKGERVLVVSSNCDLQRRYTTQFKQERVY